MNYIAGKLLRGIGIIIQLYYIIEFYYYLSIHILYTQMWEPAYKTRLDRLAMLQKKVINIEAHAWSRKSSDFLYKKQNDNWKY